MRETSEKMWFDFSVDKRERLRHDLGWFVLTSWYAGGTEYFLDQQGSDVSVMRAKSSAQARQRRTRPLNLSGHGTDIRTAKQMKARPVFDARPSSRDQEDIARARAVRDWVRWFWVRTELTSRRRRLYTDRNTTGNGFIKVFYDDHIGPFTPVGKQCEQCAGTGKVTMPADLTERDVDDVAAGKSVATMGSMNCPGCDGSGNVFLGQRRQGDMNVAIVSPWDIYPNAGATSLDTAQYITHAYPISHAAAAARYGISPEKLRPSSFLEEGDSQFAQLARMNKITQDDDKTIFVLERYETPSPSSPYPRLSIMVGDQLIYPREGTEDHEAGRGALTPEPYDRLPFLHFTDRPLPGQFFAMSRLLDAISSNDTVNRGRHNLHRHIHLSAYVKWIIERGSVSNNSINNEENEVIEWRGMNKPTQQSPAPMPEYVARTISDEEDRLYAVMGVSELDRGIAPANIEAAEALTILAEQAETSNVPMMIDDQNNFQQLAKMAIIGAIANYDDDESRIVRVIGEGGRSEARALAKADLDGNVDITCELGGASSQSLPLRRAEVFRWAQAGLLPAERATELAEFGVMGGEWGDDTRLHESDAMDENEKMAKGEPHALVVGLDDHAIHARIHRKQAHVARQAGNLQLMQILVAAAAEHDAQIAAQQQPQPGQPGPVGSGGAPLPAELSGTPLDTGSPNMGEMTGE